MLSKIMGFFGKQPVYMGDKIEDGWPPELRHQFCASLQNVESTVKAQGMMDAFKLLDSERIEKILNLLDVLDVHKVEKLMEYLKVDGDGNLEITVKINLK